MTTVTDDQIRAWLPAIEPMARQLSRVNGGVAEYDDLVQEGMISVWDALRRDREPSAQVIRFRMIDWVRYCKDEGREYLDIEQIEDDVQR